MKIPLKTNLKMEKPNKKQAKRDESTPADGPVMLKKGRVLEGHYKIGEKIGQGTFGAVYKVRDLQLNEYVALKVFRSEPEQQQIGQIELASVRRLRDLQAPDQ